MLVVSIVLVTLYLWWLNTPKLRHPELTEELRLAAEARHQAEQRYATDPEMNGYLSPTFLPLWGPETFEERPVEDSEGLNRVRAWAKYSSRFKDGVPHEQRFPDKEYWQTRADFFEVYKELRLALDRPVFVVPRERLSSLIIPKFLGEHHLSRALCTLAESLAAEGRVSESGEVLKTALKLSLSFCQLGYPATHILSENLLQGVLEALTSLVAPSTDCPSTWTQIGDLCLQAPDETAYLSRQFEDMMANLCAVMDDPDQGWPVPDSWFEWLQQRAFIVLWTILGLRRREQRFFLNGMCHLILQVREKLIPSPLTLWLSILGKVLCPGGELLEITVSGAHLTCRRLLGLGLASRLLAHRLEQGEFPDDLETLQVSRDLASATWNKHTGELHIAVERNLTWNRWKPSTKNPYTKDPWLTTTTTGWVYRLNEEH